MNFFNINFWEFGEKNISRIINFVDLNLKLKKTK